MKKLVSLCVVIAVLLTLNPHIAVAAQTPSVWAAEQVLDAITLNLVPVALQAEFTKPITRAEFCSLAVMLYEMTAGAPISERKSFIDTTDVNVQKMGGLGVVSGVGNDRFDPDGELNREQAAVVLTNLAAAAGHPFDYEPAGFEDIASVSSWAFREVGQVQAAGIMNGVGGNYFAPKDSYSREQSIATILRLYNYIQSQTPQNRLSGIFLTVADVTIRVGDTLEQVENQIGKANRIDPSGYDISWHVYNEDYSRFIMVGIRNNLVEGLYSNSKGFVTASVKYGGTSATPVIGETIFTDKYDNRTVHAYLYMSEAATVFKDYDASFYTAQEQVIFDTTNAFRVNHGLDPLGYDDIAALTARMHSQDMADNNYFDHTNLSGLSPWDRYRNNNGGNIGSGENLIAGRLFGVYAFDGWVNSEGHRDNMLGPHKYLGVGYGFNPTSTYKSYATQFFST